MNHPQPCRTDAERQRSIPLDPRSKSRTTVCIGRLLAVALVLPLLYGFTFRRRFHNGYPAEWNVGRYSDFTVQQVPRAEKSIEGKVTKIVDGGTIWVFDEHQRTRRVKLNGIIAPTGRQKYAKESQAKLTSFISNQVVVVTFTDIDQRGRILGWVKHNGINVNIAMLREGCARHDTQVKSPEFAAAEKIARRKKVGMWGP